MKMILRIEGYWVDMASAGTKYFGEKFHDETLPELLEHGDTPDDDSWFDMPIECIDDLLAYLTAFKEFSMSIYVSESSDELDIDYSLHNKKSQHHSGPYVSSRTEIKREVVAKGLQGKITQAIGILNSGRFNFGDKADDGN